MLVPTGRNGAKGVDNGSNTYWFQNFHTYTRVVGGKFLLLVELNGKVNDSNLAVITTLPLIASDLVCSN